MYPQMTQMAADKNALVAPGRPAGREDEHGDI